MNFKLSIATYFTEFLHLNLITNQSHTHHNNEICVFSLICKFGKNTNITLKAYTHSQITECTLY